MRASTDEDNYLDGVKIEPQIDKDVEEKAQQIQRKHHPKRNQSNR